MDKKIVVTIGRQFGSGGREIGQKLAKRLGISFYDKELLAIAARESGISKDIFELHDEKPTNSFLYSLVMDTYAMGYGTPTFVDMPINQRVFLAQFDTIRKIAENESCVIVGRCADYALEDLVDYKSVFVHADMGDKLKRIMKMYNVNESGANDLIAKTDKKRASYYNYYTNKKWGNSVNYDLSINSSRLGMDGTVDLIEFYLKQ